MHYGQEPYHVNSHIKRYGVKDKNLNRFMVVVSGYDHSSQYMETVRNIDKRNNEDDWYRVYWHIDNLDEFFWTYYHGLASVTDYCEYTRKKRHYHYQHGLPSYCLEWCIAGGCVISVIDLETDKCIFDVVCEVRL